MREIRQSGMIGFEFAFEQWREQGRGGELFAAALMVDAFDAVLQYRARLPPES
jgi:hypothetical protein